MTIMIMMMFDINYKDVVKDESFYLENFIPDPMDHIINNKNNNKTTNKHYTNMKKAALNVLLGICDMDISNQNIKITN